MQLLHVSGPPHMTHFTPRPATVRRKILPGLRLFSLRDDRSTLPGHGVALPTGVGGVLQLECCHATRRESSRTSGAGASHCLDQAVEEHGKRVFRTIANSYGTDRNLVLGNYFQKVHSLNINDLMRRSGRSTLEKRSSR